ncbi:phasin family protein [Methylocystis heyeri]|uniref:Phasin domain-containing protein n=1 Tax=Methylocystis heyeri TaxID=391905 RepID=A0A6B8KG44_9HYPH|nr:phasin family protein [Methylocystis heyeri]QGM47296.1 hypothetical protein H2LOC_017260 [Methylocystis heyeri]
MTTQKREVRKKFTIAPQPAAPESGEGEAAATISEAVASSPETAGGLEAELSPEIVELIEIVAEAPAIAAAPEELSSPLFPAPTVYVGETAGKAAGFYVWAEIWPSRTFDLWNENAAACFEFVSALSKAKTVSEVVALQSSFFTDRLGAYARLSSEAAKEVGSAAPKGFLAFG